jgi:hypothetical protein
MTDLARSTPAEVGPRFDERLVVLQPLGSFASHAADVELGVGERLATELARSVAERLSAAGAPAAVLPPVPFALTRGATEAPAWVSLRPGTLWALLEDVVESLEEQGVRRIVFVTGHFEAEHLRVLTGVAGDSPAVTRDRAQVLFADPSGEPWAVELDARLGYLGGAAAEDGELLERLADSLTNSIRTAWPELLP